MSDRILDDWISGYMEYTQHSESPTSYHLWSSVSCIAAALQRKVWMKWGLTTIYPNFYIVLVGPSGKARKGEPINVGRDMIDSINISTIGDDNTQEAIIKEMKRSEHSFTPTGGSPQFQSAVTCFTEELAVLTGFQNGTLLAYLTQWYDSRDKWSRFTKHQGVDKLQGICFNLLASTAPDWLPHILTREAVGGGFTSRIIFISEDRKRATVKNPNDYPPDLELLTKLEHDLELVHTISGEITFTPEANKLCEDWYYEEDQNILGGRAPLPEPIFGGYMSRRATHLKKICMAVSISEGSTKQIEKRHFDRALDMLLGAEKNMPTVFRGIGKSETVEETELLIQLMHRHKVRTGQEILKVVYREMSASTMEEIMKTLYGMGMIKAPKREDGQWIYTLA